MSARFVIFVGLNLETLKKRKETTVAKDVVMTPMMKQYFELKEKHPDAVMLFRCGDFYETYSEDAITAANILGITLTKRANGQAKHVEMAGFPFHALDTYLPKLIRAGKRVAICDQLEMPNVQKKDGISEIISPGKNESKEQVSLSKDEQVNSRHR